MSSVQKSLLITVPSQVPAYFSGIQDGTWTQVAAGVNPSLSTYQQGNRIEDAWLLTNPRNPYGTATFDGGQPNPFAYSGAAVDQVRGEYWVFGGGHGAYRGNEPYVIGLYNNTPSWRAATTASVGSFGSGNTFQGPNGAGQYDGDFGLNGYPATSHTYQRLQFANNRLWYVGTGGMEDNYTVGAYTAPRCTSKIFSFDRLELKWRAHGWALTDAQFAPYANPGEDAPCLYVPQDDVILASFKSGPEGLPHTVVVSPHSGAVIATYPYIYPTSYGMQTTAVTLISTTRKVLMISGSYFLSGLSGGTFLWDAGSPAANPIRLSVTDNTGGLPWQTEVAGIFWHEASGAAFIQRDFGEFFVKLAPNTPGNYSGGWTATKVTPANFADPNRVKPAVLYPFDVSAARPENRWNIIKNIGDGRAAIVWQQDTPRKPLYVMPLPIGGL